jgi:hypothetical protein
MGTCRPGQPLGPALASLMRGCEGADARGPGDVDKLSSCIPGDEDRFHKAALRERADAYIDAQMSGDAAGYRDVCDALGSRGVPLSRLQEVAAAERLPNH